VKDSTMMKKKHIKATCILIFFVPFFFTFYSCKKPNAPLGSKENPIKFYFTPLMSGKNKIK